jgi:hypothetical protein
MNKLVLVTYMTKQHGNVGTSCSIVSCDRPIATADDFSELVQTIKDTCNYEEVIITNFRRLESPE